MKQTILIAVLAVACISCSNNSAGKGNAVSLEEQKIDLPGVENARQLGGYVINGKKIKKDILLRAGALSKASDQAINSLENKYHLAMVFDLRSSIERGHMPDRAVPGSKEVWLPCLEKMLKELSESGKKNDFNKIGDPAKLAEIITDMAHDSTMLARSKSTFPIIASDSTIRRNFATLLDSLAVLPEGKAALWHCSYGKDRCGFASGMILAALGADRELISADFALSNDSYGEKIGAVVAKAKEMGCNDEEIRMIYRVLGVSVDDFNAVLDSIENEFGSLDNYLEQALECPESQCQTLRAKFLQ